MAGFSKFIHSNKTFFWIVLLQIVFIGAVEIWVARNSPNKVPTKQLIQASLTKANQSFEAEKLHLKQTVSSVQSKINHDPLFAKNGDLDTYSSHSVLIFESDRLINWSSNSPDMDYKSILSQRTGFHKVDFKNAVYLAFIENVGENLFVISLRLFQSSPTAFSDNSPLFVITSTWLGELDFPVQLNFQNVAPTQEIQSITLKLSENNYFATLLGYEDSLSLLIFQWSTFKERLRSLYLLGCSMFTLFFLMYLSEKRDLTQRLALRIPAFILFWILLSFLPLDAQMTDLFINWGWLVKRSLTIHLIRLNIHTVFFILLTYEIARAATIQKRFFGITWYPRTMFLSFLFGLGSYAALILIPFSFLHLINSADVQFLDPNLFPPFETLLFILGLTSSAAAGIFLTVSGNIFLLRSEQDQESYVYPFHVVGFISLHFLLMFLNKGYVEEYHFPWAAFIFYGVLLAISAYSLRNLFWFKQISLARLLLFGSLFLSVILYPLIYQRYVQLNQHEFDSKAYPLVDDFLEYSKLGNKQTTVYSHDQGIWPGTFYIAAFDSNAALVASWNRFLIPFPEQGIHSLSKAEQYLLANGEVIHKRILYDNQIFSERYKLAKKSGLIICAILPAIPLPSHLFSFFRLFYITLIVLSAFHGIRVLVSKSSIPLFDQKENLQSRILDTYVLASLLFLIALVGTTGIIISNEEGKSVQQAANAKTEDLIDAINKDFFGSFNQPFLQYLADRFELSIRLYEGNHVINTASFDRKRSDVSYKLLDKSVYDALLFGHQLNYERWQQNNAEITGSIFFSPQVSNQNPLIFEAIFRKTNRGDYEYLLRFISYLIAVYVLIFSFFIILALFISKYLANPLQQLLSGLKRISSGKLDTIVAVTTQDEIGALANAYNFMIFRLKDLQKELAEAERQAAWNEMARQVAHEIKNPLTPMKLSLQHLQRLVLQDDEDDFQLKLKFEKISKGLIQQIDSLSHIASDFSKFAKPISDDFSKVSVNSIVQGISDLYQHDTLIKITMDLSEEALFINGVADDLKRVLINLVKNSIEAMPHGGIIIIQTYRYKNDAFIEVADTGLGISITDQKSIFKPNFSTKTSGTGIGLAICKKVIEAHSGTISFASVPGSGTTFTISLPLSLD